MLDCVLNTPLMMICPSHLKTPTIIQELFSSTEVFKKHSQNKRGSAYLKKKFCIETREKGTKTTDSNSYLVSYLNGVFE